MKENGRYYYSKNLTIFIFYEFLIFLIFLVSVVMYVLKGRVESNFVNDIHTITLISNNVSKTFKVGKFHETKELYNKILKMIETIKLS